MLRQVMSRILCTRSLLSLPVCVSKRALFAPTITLKYSVNMRRQNPSQINVELVESLVRQGEPVPLRWFDALGKKCEDAKDLEGASRLLGLSKSAKASSESFLSSMMSVFMRSGRHEQVLELYSQLLRSGSIPSLKTFTTVVDTYCRMGNMKKAEETVSDMQRSNLTLNVDLFTKLAKGYARFGGAEEMYGMLKRMKALRIPPNGEIYSVIVEMFATKEQLPEALDAFEKLKLLRGKPYITTVGVLFRLLDKRPSLAQMRPIWQYLVKVRCPIPRIAYDVMAMTMLQSDDPAEPLRFLEGMYLDGMEPSTDFLQALILHCRRHRMTAEVERLSKVLYSHPAPNTNDSTTRNSRNSSRRTLE